MMAGVYLAPMTAKGSTEDDSKKTVAVPRLLATACCLLLLCLHGPRGAAGQQLQPRNITRRRTLGC